MNDFTKKAFALIVDSNHANYDDYLKKLELLINISINFHLESNLPELALSFKEEQSINNVKRNLLEFAAITDTTSFNYLNHYLQDLNSLSNEEKSTILRGVLICLVKTQKLENFMSILETPMAEFFNQKSCVTINLNSTQTENVTVDIFTFALLHLLINEVHALSETYLTILLLNEAKVDINFTLKDSKKLCTLYGLIKEKKKDQFLPLITCASFLNHARQAYCDNKPISIIAKFVTEACSLDLAFVRSYLKQMTHKAVAQSLANKNEGVEDKRDYRFILDFIRIYSFIMQTSHDQSNTNESNYKIFQSDVVLHLLAYNPFCDDTQIKKLFDSEEERDNFVTKPLMYPLAEGSLFNNTLKTMQNHVSSKEYGIAHLIIKSQQSSKLLSLQDPDRMPCAGQVIKLDALDLAPDLDESPYPISIRYQ